MIDVCLVTPELARLNGELERIGVDSYARRMSAKGVPLNILIRGIKSPAANILKQECLASGMDAAVARGVVACIVDTSDVLVMGSRNSYTRLIKRLKFQPFGLKEISERIEGVLKVGAPSSFLTKGREISLESPLLMGILNTTPDSFSDGGKFQQEDAIKKQIDTMIEDGADIIDIGGMSARPHSEHVSYTEEIYRIEYALKYATAQNILVSVDTCNEQTVKYAIDNGADIINDITGLESDVIANYCAEGDVAVCIMHMRGMPQTMHRHTDYNHVIYDVKEYFTQRVQKALDIGIKNESIIIDVGFGFAKTLEHNYILLKYLQEFAILNLPMLVGVSRKSMIGQVVDATVENRLTGTVVANSHAIMNGANIIRVHDVKEGADTIKMCNQIMRAHI